MKFDEVTKKFKNLEYMDEKRANILLDFIINHNIYNVLELGFYHGKSSAYIAAILEDYNLGKLVTIDKRNSINRKPNINQVITELNLNHRVEIIYSYRSYTWELAKIIKRNSVPFFDLCYLDGGHTWDTTGFGFILVDILLKQSGWIIFDDLDFTYSNYLLTKPEEESEAKLKYSKDELDSKVIRMVWEILAPRLGYKNMYENSEIQWGFCQKP